MQLASRIKEESSRWKQQSVKMLDCRPAPGWGERGGGLECPKRFQTSGESLLGTAESIGTQTQRNVWYLVLILIRSEELQAPQDGNHPHPKILMSTLQPPAKITKAVSHDQRWKSATTLPGHSFKTPSYFHDFLGDVKKNPKKPNFRLF